MKAVIQRVKRASVRVDGETISEIDEGILVLLGVVSGDDKSDADFLSEKIANLRIFEDEEGKMNLSVKDKEGEILVVSQFTLAGDCRKGRRPSFAAAAPPDLANELYLYFTECVKRQGINVKTGKFRAMMDVSLINNGPVTIVLESRS